MPSARRAAVAFAAFAAFFAPVCSQKPAAAFCRTTTIQEPSGYDPSVSGCWTEGTPIMWKSAPITYSLQASASRQVSFADATRVVDASFAKWKNADCSPTDPTNHPNLPILNAGATDAGLTDCGLRDCGTSVRDSLHVVIFRDDAWPHNDPNNTLALTTITFGNTSGEIFDADMEINSGAHQLVIAPPVPANAFDLNAIVTHEAGHFIGLAHSDHAQAVMFVRYQPDATQLTQDDSDAVCSVYPQSTVFGQPASSGCACAIAADRKSWIGAPLFVLGVVFAQLRRGQRQRREARAMRRPR